MRESFEEASSIAESSSTSKGEVQVQSSATTFIPPAATITSTISPTKPTLVSASSRPTRRRMFKKHRSSVPDSDASDSDASSSSTAITSDSVGSVKAIDHHPNKSKITPETLMARMRERHRQECRKSWMPSPPAEQHNKPVSPSGGFYRTASPSMPVMYPPNPMMVPIAHESMHQHVQPGIVRSASTFSGFYHPLEHPLQLRPLNNQSLPMRAIPPMSPPLSPISPVSSPRTSMSPQQLPSLSPIVTQQEHQPLKQPSSPLPSSKQQETTSHGEDDVQNQDFSLKQSTHADQGDTTFFVDKDVQTDQDYLQGDEPRTPTSLNMETGAKTESSNTLNSHEDHVKSHNNNDGSSGVRQVVPLGETMPVVLVSESETGAKQYYLLLPQQYGETLQQELQQRQQPSSCCNSDVSLCDKGASCSHQRHRHHHHHHRHHCSHSSRRSSSPSNNHCSQRHHHCCRRRPTTGSGSSRADSIVSSAQRSSV